MDIIKIIVRISNYFLGIVIIILQFTENNLESTHNLMY